MRVFWREMVGFYVGECFQGCEDSLPESGWICVGVGVGQEANRRAFGDRSQPDIAQTPAQQVKKAADGQPNDNRRVPQEARPPLPTKNNCRIAASLPSREDKTEKGN